MLRFFKRNRKEDIAHTQAAVKPSRERWFGRILNVLRSSKLDDALWEELEEILISSDVGVETSLRIIEELKKAEAEGRGAASLDGKMIDAASERMARNVLTVADAIAAQG